MNSVANRQPAVPTVRNDSGTVLVLRQPEQPVGLAMTVMASDKIFRGIAAACPDRLLIQRCALEEMPYFLFQSPRFRSSSRGVFESWDEFSSLRPAFSASPTNS
jgi:hypothetical protein